MKIKENEVNPCIERTIDTIIVNPTEKEVVSANLIANGLAGKIVLKVDENVKKGRLLAFNSKGIMQLSFGFRQEMDYEN